MCPAPQERERRFSLGPGWFAVKVLRMDIQGVPRFDLGYIIHRDYWRQGYALEACRGLVTWAEQHGLPELVASDKSEYIAIAARLAGNLEVLGSLRATLRERMSRSPLTDEVRFTRHLEDASRNVFLAAHQKHCIAG